MGFANSSKVECLISLSHAHSHISLLIDLQSTAASTMATFPAGIACIHSSFDLGWCAMSQRW